MALRNISQFDESREEVTTKSIKESLQKLARKEKAMILSKFFKTGKGQYGEGDLFLGVVVPDIRKVARIYEDIEYEELTNLLHNKYHEVRLCALLIAVRQFQKGNGETKKRLYQWYLDNTASINNWDLVDLTAEHIVGAYVDGKNTDILYTLAKSKLLWDRRIAIVATFHCIKKKEPHLTLHIAELLLHDDQDLIHKAVGWMLREVGKRCGEEQEELFLKKYANVMPRTMLRYAIERFDEQKRKTYLMVQ